MTDAVLITLITTGGTLAGVAISSYVLRQGQKKTQTLITDAHVEIQKAQTEVHEVKISIDGRMDELLELNRKVATAAGHAEGKEQERGEERDRQNVVR